MKFTPQELLRESNRLDLIACQRLRLLQLEIDDGRKTSENPGQDRDAAAQMIRRLEERVRRNYKQLENITS